MKRALKRALGMVAKVVFCVWVGLVFYMVGSCIDREKRQESVIAELLDGEQLAIESDARLLRLMNELAVEKAELQERVTKLEEQTDFLAASVRAGPSRGYRFLVMLRRWKEQQIKALGPPESD